MARRGPQERPSDLMHITSQEVPANAKMKDSSCIPLGLIATPMADTERELECIDAKDVRRCRECGAYASGASGIEEGGWGCALCGELNSAPKAELRNAPSLSSFEYEIMVAQENVGDVGGASECTCPAYFCLVDVTSGQQALALAKAAVQAAAEAVGEGCLFGLGTLSEKALTIFRFSGAKGTDDPPDAVQLHLERKGSKGRAQCDFPIEEAVPLEELWAIGPDSVADATEQLEPELNDGGERPLAGAVDALVEYLSCEQGPKRAFTRFVVLTPGKSSDGDKSFFEEAGSRAAAAGVIADVCVLPEGDAGLDSLAPLTRSSGGCLFHASSLSESMLPRDLYRELSGMLALHCTLRLRSGPELRCFAVHGRTIPDERMDDVFYMAACGCAETLVFDLEHKPTAFGFDTEAAPAFQLALEYTNLRRWQSDEGSLATDCWLRERRRRVMTIPAKLAGSSAHVQDGTNHLAVLTHVTHKAAEALATDGLGEARELVLEWMASVLRSCHGRHVESRKADLSFSHCPALRPLPRLVHGLLRSSMFQPGASADDRARMMDELSRLRPKDLALSLYPLLSAYSDCDTLYREGLPLCRQSIVTAACPLYLLDAYSTIIVYLAPSPGDHEFPPPKGSLLREEYEDKRRSRSRTPLVRHIRGGTDDISELERHFIEDSSQEGDGFNSFLEYVQRRV